LATRARVVNPYLDRKLAEITNILGSSGEFTDQVRAVFSILLTLTLRFQSSRLDAPKRVAVAQSDYLLRPKAGQKLPLETVLANDFRSWLDAGELGDIARSEVREVAGGRVDVFVSTGATAFSVECKRELKNSRPDHLQDSYSSQGTAYSVTGPPFGIVLVLDLIERTGPLPHFTDLSWVHKVRPAGSNADRYVVFVVVPGNRRDPSAMK